MAMVIKNNMSAIGTLNVLRKNNDSLAKDLKKVSTGTKITGAADDASGYAISERMRTQLRGLDQDNANAQNATSLLKTADGAIRSTLDLLKTMKEKAINAANDTNTDVDRATIQKELDQSIDQLDDNANVTFNDKTLFDGADALAYVEHAYPQIHNRQQLQRSDDRRCDDDEPEHQRPGKTVCCRLRVPMPAQANQSSSGVLSLLQ